jgi:putative CocE/NonD family hydrolase
MSTSIPGGYRVQVEFDVPVTMRDGTILRANIYQPIGDGPFPVLLSRSPYGKDLPLGEILLPPSHAAHQGYIVVIQDTRGRFSSEGEYVPFIHERDDGFDTVEWAAALPTSNGNVGMYGPSYLGFTQWAAARTNPPHLKALFPMFTWADSFEGTSMRGGAIELGLTRYWTLQNSIETELRRLRAIGDTRLLASTMLRIAIELDSLPGRGYGDLPIIGFGKRRGFDTFESFDESILQRAEATIADLSGVTGGYEDLAIPAFHIGGWYDIFLGGTLRNYIELSRRGKAPQRLLIGPWTHGSQDERIGAVHFGYGSQARLIGLQTDLYSLQFRWFDRFLKDVLNGVDQELPVQIFVMGINRWRAEKEWPLQRAIPIPYYLHSAGYANTANGDGILSQINPGNAEPTDRYMYDPRSPVPTLGGSIMLHPTFQSGPQDQRPIERREDVLVYTSEPLSDPLEVTGPISVVLYAVTDAVDTDFVARLIDVHPDGFARPLADGIIRARSRNGMANESLLTPGEIYQYTIDLWATSNVFLPGHRIRLDITSSNFPRWDRNLNTGAEYNEGTEVITAHQTILHTAQYPSHVVLPIVPAS